MTRHSLQIRMLWLASILALATANQLVAQVATAAASNDTSASNNNQEETIVLSPFVVEASKDGGYQANSTLAGTRVRTDLKDIASAVSVITEKFIQDTGATSNQTLLQFTTNTEIGGIYGNFAGVGGIYVDGASEGHFTNPNTNTRVRGLDSADNTRNYFLTDIPWDAYNTGRIDIQRGPNSILFGIGSPAGIINASLNDANFKNSYKLENRVGSFGSVRNSADFNQTLLKDTLAVKLSLLDDNTKYRQDPAYSHDKRLYGALRWDPKLFGDSATTSFRANFERGDIKANRPRTLPPTDQITPFFSSGFNKTAYDAYYAYATGLWVSAGNPSTPILGESFNYWVQQAYIGNPGAANPQFIFDNTSGNPGTALSASQVGPSGNAPWFFSIGPNGVRDNKTDGLPYRATGIGIGNFNQYTITANSKDPSLFPGAQSGFYKAMSLSDRSIFDFYNHLIDGPNKNEWQNWTAFNLSFEQTFFHNRLGIQVVYDRQNYEEGGVGLVSPAISVDINANTWSTLPWAYDQVAKYNGSGTPGTNPNAGRAYVGGLMNSTGGSLATIRDNFRTTVTGELKAEEYMQRSWATKLLGRHVFTGLYSKDTYNSEGRSWDRYAIDGAYDNQTGNGPGPNGTGISPLNNNSRTIAWNDYISAPLFNVTSAHNLNLQPITTKISLSGSANINLYDSHWKWSMNPSDPQYVDPAASWTNPTVIGGGSQASTQSENPANYVGWTNGAFKILNAEQGDINSLYRSGSKLRQVVTSEGLTWQGFLWDDLIAATYGWRHDSQVQRAGSASVSAVTGAADMNYGLLPTESKVTGQSRSWGIVLHEPKSMRDKLPWGTNFRLIYDEGNNARVQSRYAFDGSPLPNASGSTKDYGFAVSTLNDRLELKVTWYKTIVKNANMSSTLSSASTLGSNAWMLWMLPTWGMGNALQAKAGLDGDPRTAGFAYNWNWAAWEHPNDTAYENINSSQFQNDPSTAKEKAAIASFLNQVGTVLPQSWWDAYGIPVNVAEAKLGHYDTAVKGWNVGMGNYAISPAGNGKINGVEPVGTVDNESKGIEFELTGQLTKNWDIAFNASKQTASQTALGTQLSTFINSLAAFYASPAGDIRLWNGDVSQALSGYFEQNIGAAYRFQAETNGKMVPEMSPWRVNLVTNYTFKHGSLKGASCGAGYRWSEKQIIGYALKPDFSNLDINKPYWSKSETAIDLWLGYERMLTNKLNWSVQLNVRNVGDKAHLTPVSVEPDGSPALQRIREGQTWTIRNTFSF